MHSTNVRSFLKIKRSDRFQINLKIFFVFEFVSIVFLLTKKLHLFLKTKLFKKFHYENERFQNGCGAAYDCL